jgi:L-fuconolactonase
MSSETMESAETINDPDLSIVDPHHHLWFWPRATIAAMCTPASPFWQMLNAKSRYLFDEFLTDAGAGHNICATVCVEAYAMYRRHGPESTRSVGEVEFINGVAAMAESGVFGDVKACAGIVGNVDLRLADAVEGVLLSHVHAGGGRYRGVRTPIAYDSDPELIPYGAFTVPHILLDKKFRIGFRCLQKLGLSFDVWPLEPQIPEVVDLARAFPDTQIIHNHLGTPLGVGRYRGKREERFPAWHDNIRLLAKCENVAVKLGGLGMPILGFSSFLSNPPATSEQLASEWKPYVETCVEEFGVNRCMFESNFPVESSTCTYPVLWNAFKRVAAGASKDEKAALFSGTAIHVYRLECDTTLQR